ncbi:MAG TPA: pilus assembly protein N-terminal domain-containing protein [Methylomirabilota bacterium]
MAGAQQGPVRLEVTIGKSQVVDLKDPFTRVSVTNPGIADVFTISPNQLLLNGKTPGVTSLIVFYPDRTIFFDVVVQTDMALLVERLREIAPRDDIQVQAAQDAIIVRGTVSSEQMIPGAGAVAAAFAPKGRVINLLALAEVKPQQILLQMHVAEVAREALKELGFSWRALGKTLQGAAFPGFPFFPALGLLGGVQTTSGAIQNVRTPEFDFNTAQAGSGFFLSSGGQRDYAGIAQALARRNALRTLAKPNLITQSGKEAKFISGGEFPFPVAQQNNTVTIEFKEFGVSILFTPVIMDGEIVNLRVRPEVSTLDFTQGLIIQGFRIPAIRKNQAATSLNLKDGETFAMAGLINNQVRQEVSKVPLLGDIPILGTLFRSIRFLNDETELLFLVTVKLVNAAPAGSASVPDATKLMELREEEKNEFTMIPGFPGVGEVVDRPFGKSSLEPPAAR